GDTDRQVAPAQFFILFYPCPFFIRKVELFTTIELQVYLQMDGVFNFYSKWFVRSLCFFSL
ncbi:MAG: hypothetical protein ABI855_09190, partial [Bacteroidota bacterium]